MGAIGKTALVICGALLLCSILKLAAGEEKNGAFRLVIGLFLLASICAALSQSWDDFSFELPDREELEQQSLEGLGQEYSETLCAQLSDSLEKSGVTVKSLTADIDIGEKGGIYINKINAKVDGDAISAAQLIKQMTGLDDGCIEVSKG